jgi:predicted peroxiredoxin
MAGQKVVVNLATGLEDAERVTVAFLVGGAALDQGKQVAIFLTKEAVRLATPGVAVGVACEGCPPLPKIFEQFAEKGGELLACPFCVNSRGMDRRRARNRVQLLKLTAAVLDRQRSARPLPRWLQQACSWRYVAHRAPYLS